MNPSDKPKAIGEKPAPYRSAALRAHDRAFALGQAARNPYRRGTYCWVEFERGAGRLVVPVGSPLSALNSLPTLNRNERP